MSGSSTTSTSIVKRLPDYALEYAKTYLSRAVLISGEAYWSDFPSNHKTYADLTSEEMEAFFKTFIRARDGNSLISQAIIYCEDVLGVARVRDFIVEPIYIPGSIGVEGNEVVPSWAYPTPLPDEPDPGTIPDPNTTNGVDGIWAFTLPGDTNVYTFRLVTNSSFVQDGAVIWNQSGTFTVDNSSQNGSWIADQGPLGRTIQLEVLNGFGIATKIYKGTFTEDRNGMSGQEYAIGDNSFSTPLGDWSATRTTAATTAVTRINSMSRSAIGAQAVTDPFGYMTRRNKIGGKYASVSSLFGGSLLNRSILHSSFNGAANLGGATFLSNYTQMKAELLASFDKLNNDKEAKLRQHAFLQALELGKQSYLDAELMRAAGVRIRDYYQGMYENQFKMWHDAQTSKVRRLDVLGNGIRALVGTVEAKTTTGYRPSPVVGALGGALSGAAAGAAFGAPGAIIGGLIGLAGGLLR